MKIRFRHTVSNDVDYSQTFTAKITGGMRGYGDSNALEPFSNTMSPCIRCSGENFIMVVERQFKILEIHGSDDSDSGDIELP